MNPMQPTLAKAKKTLKFIWLHVCTLYILSVIARAIFAGHVQGENACGWLVGAVLLDWAKQFIRFGSSSNPYADPHRVHPYNDVTVPLHVRQWWNPGFIGTASYESDNYPRVKYD